MAVFSSRFEGSVIRILAVVKLSKGIALVCTYLLRMVMLLAEEWLWWNVLLNACPVSSSSSSSSSSRRRRRSNWYSPWWGNTNRAVKFSFPACYRLPFFFAYIYVFSLLTGHPFANWLMPIVTVQFSSMDLMYPCSVWNIYSILLVQCETFIPFC